MFEINCSVCKSFGHQSEKFLQARLTNSWSPKMVFSSNTLCIALFALTVILTTYLFMKKAPRKRTASLSRIPGPKGIPILGTSWVFTKLGGYSLDKIHNFYEDMFKRYGPIVKVEALWNIPVINVVNRDDIEKVVKASGKYPIRPPTEVIAYYRKSRPDRYASTGMINEQGPNWLHLRTSLTNDLVSPRTISSYLPQFKDMADDFCDLIRFTRTKDSKVELVEISKRLGLEASAALVLGRRMDFLQVDCNNEKASRLSKAIQKQFIACRDTYYGLPFWKLYPTYAYKLLTEGEDEIYNIALELAESADEATKDSIIFQSILKADIDEREKTAAIVDFIVSGIHTLGNTLILLLQLVAGRKDIQDRIILSNDEDRTALLRACVNESFRVYPTAHCLARITEMDLELAGYMVPSGTVVVCQSRLACMDQKNFDRPLEFRPERWLNKDERAQTLQNAAYLVIPFGYGRRSCPGKRFIEHTLPIILNRILTDFIIEPDPTFELECQFLMAPKGQVHIAFIDRNKE